MPALLEFFEDGEAQIERAADEHECKQECDELGAGIDLAHQFARELAQEYFGVVAPRCGCGFDSCILNERRDVNIRAALRHERRRRAQREKLQREIRVGELHLIAVFDLAPFCERRAIVRQPERRVESSMTYQAASGAGAQNMRELLQQMGEAHLAAKSLLDDPGSAILDIDREVAGILRDEHFPTEHFGVPLRADFDVNH